VEDVLPCAAAPLTGHVVALTADRRADEQAALLRRRGAEVVHGATVHVGPLVDERPLREATEAILADPPDVLLVLTGIGVRSWSSWAAAWGVDELLRDALAGARVVARGP
jgi:uroporphyrinogen-III synthase